MMVDYVIGIEGGATKAVLQLADTSGKRLMQVTGGSLNVCSLPEEQVRQNLQGLFAQLWKSCPGVVPSSVCIGTAGAVSESNKLFYQKAIREITGCSIVTACNDALIALYGQIGEKSGFSITAGTGSICIGKNETGRIVQVGGWGHLFSDEGSAYAIAIAALRVISHSVDGRIGKTKLLPIFFDAIHVSNMEGLISYFYNQTINKATIAALSPLVDQAAEEDEIARNLLREAANDLFLLCDTVVQQLEFRDAPFYAALNGSVLQQSRYVRQDFLYLLQKAYPMCHVLTKTQSAVDGAVLLALEAVSASASTAC